MTSVSFLYFEKMDSIAESSYIKWSLVGNFTKLLTAERNFSSQEEKFFLKGSAYPFIHLQKRDKPLVE